MVQLSLSGLLEKEHPPGKGERVEAGNEDSWRRGRGPAPSRRSSKEEEGGRDGGTEGGRMERWRREGASPLRNSDALVAPPRARRSKERARRGGAWDRSKRSGAAAEDSKSPPPMSTPVDGSAHSAP
mmetsp:Transcript_42449/g.100738  ORF Transcript_42449/g.100738 Transcript_42449/m.100738 type:complete len:127 (+) Transcript_42449:187-567(+)